MIKITTPKLSEFLNLNQLNTIPYNAGGIYFIYDESGDLTYLGKAKNLQQRLALHFIGKTHTKDFHHKFYNCRYFVNSSEVEREIYETYLINKLSPTDNVAKVYENEKQIFADQSKESFIGFVVKLLKINKNIPIGIHTIKQLCENNSVQIYSFYDDYINSKLIENKIKIDARELTYVS